MDVTCTSKSRHCNVVSRSGMMIHKKSIGMEKFIVR